MSPCSSVVRYQHASPPWCGTVAEIASGFEDGTIPSQALGAGGLPGSGGAGVPASGASGAPPPDQTGPPSVEGAEEPLPVSTGPQADNRTATRMQGDVGRTVSLRGAPWPSVQRGASGERAGRRPGGPQAEAGAGAGAPIRRSQRKFAASAPPRLGSARYRMECARQVSSTIDDSAR